MFECERNKSLAEQTENESNWRNENQKHYAEHDRVYDLVQEHAKLEPQEIQWFQKTRGQKGSRCEGKPQRKRPVTWVFASKNCRPQGNDTKYNSEGQAKVLDARRLAVIMTDYTFLPS